MTSGGRGSMRGLASGAAALLIVAACGSFTEQRGPAGDAGTAEGGAEGSVGDGGPPGECGVPLGTLAPYVDAAREVVSLAANANALWYGEVTAIYRKAEGAPTAPIQSVDAGFGIGPIALTPLHATWIAGNPNVTRMIYSAAIDGTGSPTAFRQYADTTLVASPSETVFYGSVYGVAASSVAAFTGGTDVLVKTSDGSVSTAPVAIAVGGGTVAFIAPALPGEGNAVLVGSTNQRGGPPKEVLASSAPNATSIAVSTDGARVYWTQTTGEIMTAAADGSASPVAIAMGLTFPHALALDGAWLYVLTDSALVRMHPDGTCTTTTAVGSPSHLAVGGGYVYVAASTKIMRGPK